MGEFTRFFRVSGINHCMTGPSAWFIGQGGGIDVAIAKTLPFDGEHNVFAAIVDWVEDGVPPETTTRTKLVNDTMALSIIFSGGIAGTHCRTCTRKTESQSPG
ncbi:hypothetical protein CGRA01v4_08372 [Colletotrichum graminicola]|uniref:Uncharacterized protein n=1 Tax=Colletotrichum graminicola (strain M1.001 / M2 / FGSC 10212) TaxID=645133 RepID=E3QME2_COLGM|nr:uncharacterized protein GLRG_07174 [Colletotrichum graminicola M1.001]EFQ32030.1 hypothetical protein GLRG_07174 [Colletotrichum graminicola M1.001]WDK17089.1 hypothetical protein CGRA01v4_08372 [Colletotrichum graminicola]